MRNLLVLKVVLLLLPWAVFGKNAEPFEAMKSLVGEWQREGDTGGAFRVKFSTTANGTVLVEEWEREGRSHSMTLYHQDGDAIMATHYCPQGNQPRLRSIPGEVDGVITFFFHDITDLRSPESSHQRYLSFKQEADGRVVRREMYRAAGVDSTSPTTCWLSTRR